MHICFLLSYSPNPRMKKRMSLLKSTYEVSLIYWRRTDVDIWGNKEDEYQSVEINTLSNNGNPLGRIFPTVKFAIKSLVSLYKKKPDIIYSENIDMLFIARVYSWLNRNKIKIIYEIADIHSLLIDTQNKLSKTLIQKLLVKIDEILCKKIDLLVNTSEKFYDIYYSRFVPRRKYIFMPNMPDSRFFESYSKKNSGEFTVGFIGAIRYKEQMKMLIRATQNIKMKVLFAGAGIDDEIEKICQKHDHVRYYGGYDYKNEISKLYGEVDCVYSVYDASVKNVRLALPNKLYESIYCDLPIIVAKKTYLSELVDDMGVGISISHESENELEEALIKLSTDNDFYNKVIKACISNKQSIDIGTYNMRLMKAIDEMIQTRN